MSTLRAALIDWLNQDRPEPESEDEASFEEGFGKAMTEVLGLMSRPDFDGTQFLITADVPQILLVNVRNGPQDATVTTFLDWSPPEVSWMTETERRLWAVRFEALAQHLKEPTP